MIDKIIRYVQDKLPVIVSESVSTNSKYIRLSDSGKLVRISDHFGNVRDSVDITIIIPENSGQFIVVLGFKTFIYNSFQKVCDLIIMYLILEEGIFSKETAKIKNQAQNINDMKLKIDTLNSEVSKLKTLNSQLSILNRNLSNNGIETELQKELQKKVKRQAAEIKTLNEKQVEYKEIIKRQEEDIKEAAQLLEEVSTNPELREMLYDSHAGKKYYLDNFSEDAQDILKDIIKDYYNK